MSVEFKLEKLPKTDKMRQLIHSVLSSITFDGCSREPELCNLIADKFTQADIEYIQEPILLIPADMTFRNHKKIVYHNNQYYYTSTPDFLLGSSVLEVKWKDKLSSADKGQLVECLSCPDIDKVFLAFFRYPLNELSLYRIYSKLLLL